METKQSFLEGMMSEQTSAQPQTGANLIGAILLGVGFYGAYKQKTKSYEEATKDIQSSVQALLPAHDARAEKAQTQLAADLAGYQTRTESAVESGLKARGIGDKAVVKESVGRVGSGLSGAYAAAAAALKGASLNAKGALSSSMSRYYQDLAQKQYQSLMNNYASKMGLWGALGGMGASMMGTKPAKDISAKDTGGRDYTSEISNAPIIEEEFRMKGVKDSPPIMLDPRYGRNK